MKLIQKGSVDINNDGSVTIKNFVIDCGGKSLNLTRVIDEIMQMQKILVGEEQR